ncbi:MAG: hypothetical protein KI790_19425 [Cyclobacteriaceae bacterium]|nr:hypothetical protein [Cyclobacteriaceae bacterium HetDA_MAG_MS6]
MYPTLLAVHSILRWIVLSSIVFGIYTSAEGLISKRAYTSIDQITRGVTSGISHLQLLIGLLLYASVSPITRSFLENGAQGNDQLLFFGVWHAAAMIAAVVMITIGAAVAKRAATDQKKFRVTLIWFTVALLTILSAIPWFRPFLRAF